MLILTLESRYATVGQRRGCAMMKLTKREFLTTAIKGLIYASIGRFINLPKYSHAQAIPPYLAPNEKAIFRAFISRLVPKDKDPGVVELSMGNLIETMLRVTPEVRPVIPVGLKGVDETSRLMFDKKGFLELRDADKDKVIKAIELGKAQGETWKKLSSQKFFDTIRMFTVGIYYSDPAVWTFIGYPGPGQPHGYLDYADFQWP